MLDLSVVCHQVAICNYIDTWGEVEEEIYRAHLDLGTFDQCLWI